MPAVPLVANRLLERIDALHAHALERREELLPHDRGAGDYEIGSNI